MEYTSEVIAEYTGKCHHTICELIRNHTKELNKIQNIERCKISLKTAGRPKIVFHLTKQQCIYLLLKMSSRTNIENAVNKLNLNNDIKIIKHRNELEFLKILEMIVDGFNQGTGNNIRVENQYNINGDRIDYCIVQNIAGEDCIILLIEYDEDKHKYYKKEDLKRENRIVEYLSSIDTSGGFEFKICRVTDDNFLNAISDIICCMNSEMCIEGAGTNHEMNTISRRMITW